MKTDKLPAKNVKKHNSTFLGLTIPISQLLSISFTFLHPFLLAFDSNGQAYGIYFKNTNAMEIDIAPGPTVSYRTTGGIFDFYFFTGPTPRDVIRQYTEIFGRPAIPPYWALGFQLSKWGYNDLATMQATYQRNVDAGIPLDVIYGDIDYMERFLDFTVDQAAFANFDGFLDTVHSQGKRFVPILDPVISVEETDAYSPTVG